MSQENVEVARRGYEHYNRTGEPDYSVLDPEVVYDASSRTFDPLVYHGHEGIREFLALIREQWATFRLEPQEFVDAGDSVVVSVRLVGVGKESGVETTANAAHLWTLRGGKIVR
jgi:ketosteroid isomerase-like protein